MRACIRARASVREYARFFWLSKRARRDLNWQCKSVRARGKGADSLLLPHFEPAQRDRIRVYLLRWRVQCERWIDGSCGLPALVVCMHP